MGGAAAVGRGDAAPSPHCAVARPRGVYYNRIPKSGSESVLEWIHGVLCASVLSHDDACVLQTNGLAY